MATSPPRIHNLLSSLRSSIFSTAHNPSNARTGAKYLRRRLVGPSAVKYYPSTTSLRVLNANVPWNKYGNWEGIDTVSWRREAIAGSSSGQKWDEGSMSGSSESDTSKAVEAGKEGEVASAKGDAGSEGSGTRWMQQNLPLSQAVEPGWTEVARLKGAGWLDDQRERTRREEVAIMKLMGRGPPKKGQGKRSQMKKR